MFKTYERTHRNKTLPKRKVEWGKLGRQYAKEDYETLCQKIVEDSRKRREQRELEE